MQGVPCNVSSLPSQIPRRARDDTNSPSSRERCGDKCGPDVTDAQVHVPLSSHAWDRYAQNERITG
jgi:hypothetical protein